MEALAVCSDKNLGIGITIWDLETGDRILHLPTSASSPHGLVCLGNQYLVASQVQRAGSVCGGVIFKWPLNKPHATLRSYLLEAVGPLSCTKDGIYLASGAPSGNMYIWEVTSGRLLKKWSAHRRPISCVAFSMDDSLLITSSEDGTIATWSLMGLLDEQNSGRVPSLWSFSAVHGAAVTGLVSLSSNSTCDVISSSLDGTCKILDVVTGKIFGSRSFSVAITTMVVNELENVLCCGNAKGTIFLNRVDAGLDEVFPKEDGPQIELSGHQKSINALTFCRLGLISSSDDCTVCLWDIGNCVIIRRFNHPKGRITNLVVIRKSSLIPSKNSLKTSPQFRVSLLDKSPQPPNFAKGALTILSSNVDAQDQEQEDPNSGYRSMKLLEKQILDLEQERTPEALQMKVDANRANQRWALRMGKRTMKLNRNLQCSYLDFLHGRLLQRKRED